MLKSLTRTREREKKKTRRRMERRIMIVNSAEGNLRSSVLILVANRLWSANKGETKSERGGGCLFISWFSKINLLDLITVYNQLV